MGAVELTADDIVVFDGTIPREQAEILCRDGLALARRIAPCIDDEDFAYPEAAVAIIRGAVLRWASSGAGGVASQQTSAGPFSQTTSFDNRTGRKSLFFPSEVTELERLCQEHKRGAFGVDTLPPPPPGCPDDCSFVLASLNSECGRCGRTLRRGLP